MARFLFFFFILLFSSSVLRASEAADYKLALREVKQSIKTYEALNNYTATFSKHEYKDADWLQPETFFMKFRKPFEVYMMGLKGPNKGYELIYVDGKWNNQVIAHVPGLLNLVMPAIKLQQDNYFMLKNNRHRVQDVGIGYMINAMRSQFLTAADHGDLMVKYLGSVREGDEEGDFFEFHYNSSKNRQYYCPVGKVVFSKKNLLPIHLWAYQDPEGKELIEEYQYSNVKVNVGLTEEDFDPANKKYSFGTVI